MAHVRVSTQHLAVCSLEPAKLSLWALVARVKEVPSLSLNHGEASQPGDDEIHAHDELLRGSWA